jgi:HK97 family phage prohead protease
MSSLDILGKQIFEDITRRTPGGKVVLYNSKQLAFIKDYIETAPKKLLLAAVETKTPAPASASPTLTVMQRSANSSSSLTWAFKLTDESVDLQGDVIKVDGWDLSNCGRNLPTLYNHESDQPVGQWSMPVKSGGALLATTTFPEPGISAMSDQVRGMVAAGVLRGCSVGFVPGRFEFATKDPQRPPFSINFLSGHRLIEASICSVPANQSCLVIGPTSAKALDDFAVAARQAEVRNIISSLGKSGQASRSAPLSREQRIAEARRLINEARR